MSISRPIIQPKNVYSPLPNDKNDNEPAPKAVYGKTKGTYEGSKSQGNRFILDRDL